MKAREQSTDKNGNPLTPGTKVRVLGEDGQPEGTVVRVLGDYDCITVLIDQKGKAERLFPTRDVQIL